MKQCRKCNTMKTKKGFYADNICKSCGRKYPRVTILEIHHSQINYNEDTCLVSINKL